MLADIQEICIVCNENDVEAYKMLLANGHQLGLNLTYVVQDSPGGIPHGLLVAKDFYSRSSTMLVLGDNILHGTWSHRNNIFFKIFRKRSFDFLPIL